MFYLEVGWTDGTDADYFKFNTLDRAILYIRTEVLED